MLNVFIAARMQTNEYGADVSLAAAVGPLVVNEDGTMSRISNWENMADIEKQNTLRILGKRNKARLDALKAKAQASGSQS